MSGMYVNALGAVPVCVISKTLVEKLPRDLNTPSDGAVYWKVVLS